MADQPWAAGDDAGADALFEAELGRMEMPAAAVRVDASSSNSDDALAFEAALSQMELPAPAVSSLGGLSAGSNARKRPRTIASTSSALVLPPPSAEQQAVIDAVLSGYCVSLPSVAGSGKTTCMLQVVSALPPGRSATIITYNRALADECKDRAARCGLAGRVRPFTVHGLVTRVSGRICNDDSKLRQIVTEWDRRGGVVVVEGAAARAPLPPMDLVLLDEAQDLRPMFYRAICHILRAVGSSTTCSSASSCSSSTGRTGDVRPRTSPSVQMCLVGDPKQMLYDFPTYGSDKASIRYMERPEEHWGKFTAGRAWVRRKLTVSYRLTPNIASFVNAIWGTAITGGNDRDPNIPVEYHCKFPYPASNPSETRDKLSTQFLDSLIKEHGPENVLFLAQSVKNENCPIRVHVNALCEMRNKVTGEQVHNFHIKESLRGYEANNDVKNKVRVWTYCGSKGCEADVVVLFGLDMYGWRVHALNQVGVALSRAKKRLIVIHGKSFTGKGRNAELIANPYYPLLGDSPNGMQSHVVTYNGNETIRLNVPPCAEGDQEMLAHRSELVRSVIEKFAGAGVVRVANDDLPSETKETKENEGERVEAMYVASEFAYFSASEELRFLDYASWTKEAEVGTRIDYKVSVQFNQTSEDVSALYGEALTYMLQWERDGFCPNIETIVNDGILQVVPYKTYKEPEVRDMMRKKQCERLSDVGERLLRNEFAGGKTVKGKELISFVNVRMAGNVRKKRVDGDRIILFPVKAIEESSNDGDNMSQFLGQIRAVYCSSSSKTPAQWVYLANAVMAFSNYVEKFHQIGTSAASYDRWVESAALGDGLSRLKDVMKRVPSYSSASTSPAHADGIEDDSFERELLYEFSKECQISSPTSAIRVVGIQGVCDWIGRGLVSPQGSTVDLLEIKFVNELCNMHRLQVLTYCALLSLERDKAISGMLYNARTGELEVCSIARTIADDFLLDIAQFKFNGQRRQRQDEGKGEASNIVICLPDGDSSSSDEEKENKSEIGVTSSCSDGTMDNPIEL